MLARALRSLGEVLERDGDLVLAGAAITEALTLDQQLETNQTRIPLDLLDLAVVRLQQGHLAEGTQLAEEALTQESHLGHRAHESIPLATIGLGALLQGALDHAEPSFHQALTVSEEVDDQHMVA